MNTPADLEELMKEKEWTDAISAARPMAAEEVREALDLAISQVRKNIPCFEGGFPGASSKDGRYPRTANDDWTNGFYTGMLWLSYEETGDEIFKQEALRQVDDFLDRIKKRIVVDHHDMGFLYSPSCVAAYKLTGYERGKEAALLAADNLMGRFQEKGGFFQAWGSLGAADNYRLIVDCLLNVPLLFWAGQVTGKEKYREKAQIHIETSMKYLLRPDYSTYHTYYFDPDTGNPLRGVTQQGYRNDSIWARGQAWGIYGTALSYSALRKEEYLEIFRKVADCFLEHLPDDLVPYWDFDFREGNKEPRDSSSGAIAACGMLEMAAYLPEKEAGLYRETASKLLKALTDTCLNREPAAEGGILQHGTYAKSSPENGVSDSGVDEYNLWGDYFYMEGLTRLSREWGRYW